MTVELAVAMIPIGETPLVDLVPDGTVALLDSSLPDIRQGRYSYLGLDPFATLTVHGTRGRLVDRAGVIRHVEGDPFEMLESMLAARTIPARNVPPGAPPFLGGGIGYLAYELARHLEQLPTSTIDDLELPELAVGFYDTVVAHDHLKGTTTLVVTTPEGADPTPAIDRALAILEQRREAAAAHRASSVVADVDEAVYLEAVRRIKDYIAAGDIYQANLTQRFRARIDDAWAYYRRLRRANPAPFAAFLDYGTFQVASSSPERFLLVSGRDVETRPIKGTRRRSPDPEADEALQAELRSSVKDIAELSMIVDVERNDLGRICEYGSVEVADHAALESYATVHHLVSTVRGKLRPDIGIVDVLRASFPSGSVTGAPKIRAMEIIDELEPTVRSVYTGAIGYFGFNGEHQLNVAIRTVIHAGGTAYVQVGGGVVADSEAAAEYEETMHKGKAMFQAVSGEA